MPAGGFWGGPAGADCLRAVAVTELLCVRCSNCEVCVSHQTRREVTRAPDEVPVMRMLMTKACSKAMTDALKMLRGDRHA